MFAEDRPRTAPTMAQRVHVMGASGSGVTTLGRSLTDSTAWPYYDTDDFYWQPTDPPFRMRRSPEDRLHRLSDALLGSEQWVLGGAIDGWGDPLIARFDLVVFLEAPTATRRARLSNRERGRFGDRVAEGGDMHAQHQAFLAWADGYEAGANPQGRSRARHEAWLRNVDQPILRLDATQDVEVLKMLVLAAL